MASSVPLERRCRQERLWAGPAERAARGKAAQIPVTAVVVVPVASEPCWTQLPVRFPIP